MKKLIVKELLQRLANAPEEVARNYIKTLSDDDRADAERLAEALGIYKKGGK